MIHPRKLLLAGFLLASSARAEAQTPRTKMIVINTLIGASTAGITAALHHRPILRAVLGGSVGGLTVFAGKCVIAQRVPVTDWIGHETVAVGSSMVANASTGRAILERVVLPVGPVRIIATKGKPALKLDLLQTAVAGYYSVQSGAAIDWSLSAKHGALVVYDRNARNEYEVAGVITTWNRHSSLLVHELIHVAQEEFVTTAWEEPLEGWILSRIPGGKVTHRYLDFGILAPVWAVANSMLAHESRPWEKEAETLSNYC